MKLLFVVQRYGLDVAGGAERCCREFASRLAARGHEVHVLTSCARSYVDWANHYPEGVEVLDGVQVHRLPVSMPRPHHRFGDANNRVMGALLQGRPTPVYVQESWMHLMGPTMPGLTPWIVQYAAEFDVAIFYTYLYFSTWKGLQDAHGRVPTVFHPTAHREPYLALALFDAVFRSADAYGYLTEEEETLVASRFGYRRRSMVTGIGVDLDAAPDQRAVAAFRAEHGIGDRPYLAYVGRVDPNKGTGELFGYFELYKQRNPGPLALVVIGEALTEVPAHPDIVVTGFVDLEVMNAGVAGCSALVHPSYYESFSMVLTEAWALQRPVIAQGGSDVLVGQCRRSGGGLPYDGYEEFEACVDAIVGDPQLAAALGARGRAFVEDRYEWTSLLERYEVFLEAVAGTGVDSP